MTEVRSCEWPHNAFMDEVGFHQEFAQFVANSGLTNFLADESRPRHHRRTSPPHAGAPPPHRRWRHRIALAAIRRVARHLVSAASPPNCVVLIPILAGRRRRAPPRRCTNASTSPSCPSSSSPLPLPYTVREHLHLSPSASPVPATAPSRARRTPGAPRPRRAPPPLTTPDLSPALPRLLPSSAGHLRPRPSLPRLAGVAAARRSHRSPLPRFLRVRCIANLRGRRLSRTLAAPARAAPPYSPCVTPRSLRPSRHGLARPSSASGRPAVCRQPRPFPCSARSQPPELNAGALAPAPASRPMLPSRFN
nr:proline-rich receptor-like protein kinase PERK9 [Aegilops tauschii subsp. strangulata]